MADVILPLLTSVLALGGVLAALGACVHAYRRMPDRDTTLKLWTPSGLSEAVAATLSRYTLLEHRATTTHLLAAAQVALAIACAIEWRVEGTLFHLVFAAFLTASTTALVSFDALSPRPGASPIR